MATYRTKTSKTKTEAPPKTWDAHKFLSYGPNGQQQAALEAVQTRENGIVMALAGVGKTTLLRMICEDERNRDLSILYLAFNRGVADSADPVFPPNTKCLNYHRIAFNFMRDQAWKRNGKYPSDDFIANALRVQPFTYTDGNIKETITPDEIGGVIAQAIGEFCKTADYKPTGWHISKTTKVRRIVDTHRQDFIAHVLPYVTAAWNDIKDPNGRLPYMPGRGDGCYVKLWSLANPTLRDPRTNKPYDLILFDEGQDAQPPVAAVVERQSCQVVYVGDSNQAIYGFTGAVDALKKVTEKNLVKWVKPLTKSYRFGQAVADAGNEVLAMIPGNELRLEGFEQIESQVDELGTPDCTLCRTNAGVIENALNLISTGMNVAIAGGTSEIESFTENAHKMIDPDAAYQRHTSKQQAKGKGAVPREKWLKVNTPQLKAFKTWEEVTLAVEEGDDDSGIAMMVRLINNYGVEVIYKVCENSSRLREGVNPVEWASEPGNTMVSTAHKAKGLEWNTVKIGDDFKPPKEGHKLALSELMLIYVAVTRAKLTLDMRNLAWLKTLAEEMLNGDHEGLGEL